jgi:hypothetical protein
MKRFDLPGIHLEVDEERTQALYKSPVDNMEEWCQCDGCTNARLGRGAIPKGQLELLSALGIHPYMNAGSNWVSRLRIDGPGTGRRTMMYYLYGELTGESEKVYFDAHNWLWIDNKPSEMDLEGMRHFDLERHNLLFVRTSNRLPRVLSHLCKLKFERSPPSCPNCGSHEKQTGYLRKKGRLPELLNISELRSGSLDSKVRVLGIFCYQCGHFGYEVVPNKPPFRSKVVEKRPKISAAMQRRYQEMIESGELKVEPIPSGVDGEASCCFVIRVTQTVPIEGDDPLFPRTDQ